MGRTQVVGLLVVVVVVLAVLGLLVVGVMRPLPSRAASLDRQVQDAVAMLGDRPGATDEAIAALAGVVGQSPRFGEHIPATNGGPPYDLAEQHAIEALGRIRSPAAVAALTEIATRGDRRLSLYAVEALRQQGDRAAAPALITVLGQEDERLHRLDDNFTRLTNEAVRALREVGDAAALQSMRQLRQNGLRAIDGDVARGIRALEQKLQEQAEIKEPQVPGAELR